MPHTTYHPGQRRSSSLFGQAGMPKAELAELDKEFELTLELPGVPKDDVSITVEQGVLTVGAERVKPEGLRAAATYGHYGELKRSFRLPDGTDVDKVSATLGDGLLHLTLPKPETMIPRRIPVTRSAN